MSIATDRLAQFNGGIYNASTNPYGFDGADGGVSGLEANLPQALNDVGVAAGEIADLIGTNRAVGPSLPYAWDAGTTDADPGTGELRANHATLASATALYVSTTDASGAAVSAILDSCDDSTSTVKGRLRLAHRTDSTVWADFTVTGSVVSATGYRKLTVGYVAGSGTLAAGDPVALGFVRTGDKGDTGTVSASTGLLVNQPSSYQSAFGETPLAQISQLRGTTAAPMALYTWGNDAIGARLILGKSRGTAVGAQALVQSGDELGGLYFCGSNGISMNDVAAAIVALVGGTPGASSDMPGRLRLGTTPDGAASPSWWIEIGPDGTVTLGGLVGSGAPLRAVPVAGGNRGIVITQSAGGNPSLGTSDGNLDLTPATGITTGLEFAWQIALSDEVTALTTGTAVVTLRAPFGLTLTRIPRASLSTASASGLVTVDIKAGGSSVLGTNKLSIDATEKTSTTAATATTLATASVADDAEITIDITAAGSGAKGLKLTLYAKRT